VISTAIKKGVAKQSWIDAAVRSMTTLNKAAAEVITGNYVRAGASLLQGERNPHPSKTAKDGAPSSVANDRRPTTNDGFSVHAMTDITGFGLIGHLREMALASNNISVRIHASRIPLIEGALECVRSGHIPAGLKANREFAECVVQYEEGIPEDLKTILFDPQTAGGLLISIAATAAAELQRALNQSGVPALDIGEVLPLAKRLIEVAQ